VDFNKNIRVIAGARIEWTEQRIDPYNQFGGEVDVAGANLTSTDVLPSISSIFSLSEKVKLRASYAHTLARPQVRELAPFAFSDYFGGTVTSGNPDLVLTEIKNVDARFEYWPSLTEVLAVSLFYKRLKNPIESLQIPTGGAPQVTFRNADYADVLGAEFEVRKSLGFLSSVLRPFSVISNLTLTWSQTEVQEDPGNEILTNPVRPLINQAPWVVNLALDYQNESGTGARLSYNINGDTLVQVGTFGLPDAYEHSFNSLDLSGSQKFLEHWSVKLSIENIINDNVLKTQGKKLDRGDGDSNDTNVALEYREGTTISLGFGYEI
jgi:TonB-dependent receptor